MRIVPRPVPEATQWPSALKATSLTSPVDGNGAPTWSPLTASHSRTVSSCPPETRRDPAGLNATASTAPSCPTNGLPTACPDALSQMRKVPSAPAAATRPPVRTKRDGIRIVAKTQQRRTQGLSRGSPPQSNGVVVAR